jgi:Asp/Glu/hydantoin racemase
LRLLIHNPNSNADLTARLGTVAKPLLKPGQTLALSTATRGPDFIGTDATVAVARAQLFIELGEKAAHCDAVLLGCFGDFDIDSLRREIGKPIVSLWDAFFVRAAFGGERCGIVTTSEFWKEKLLAEVSKRGLLGRVVAIEVINVPAAASNERLAASVTAALERLADRPDVDTTVLGGALLVALRLSGKGRRPLFDVLNAAIKLAAL